MAMNRWFTKKYLNSNPNINDEFMNILNKTGEDHLNFIKAYDFFANYIDDETKVKNIMLHAYKIKFMINKISLCLILLFLEGPMLVNQRYLTL